MIHMKCQAIFSLKKKRKKKKEYLRMLSARILQGALSAKNTQGPVQIKYK